MDDFIAPASPHYRKTSIQPLLSPRKLKLILATTFSDTDFW